MCDCGKNSLLSHLLCGGVVEHVFMFPMFVCKFRSKVGNPKTMEVFYFMQSYGNVNFFDLQSHKMNND